MDASAIALARDNNLPIIVFSLDEPGGFRGSSRGRAPIQPCTARAGAKGSGPLLCPRKKENHLTRTWKKSSNWISTT
jgi:hypothetical protein